jgi:L-ribulose-5-phosphate 3-epimerase
MITRRELLAGTALAGAALGKSRIDRSRLSAITDELAKTPEEAIDFARKYRLQFLELRNVPGGKEYAFLPEAEVKLAAAQFARHNIRISFLNSSLLKFQWPDTLPARPRNEAEAVRSRRLQADSERFARRIEDVRTACRNCHILGVGLLRVFTGFRVAEPEKLMPRIVDVIGEMGRLAEREKIRLLIENEASCNVGTSAELAALLKQLPSKWIGANWDSLNGLSLGEQPFPAGYEALPKERIFNVQVKGKQILEFPERMDWKPVFRRLEKDGYEGKIGLETHIFGEGQIAASHAAMQELVRIVEEL